MKLKDKIKVFFKRNKKDINPGITVFDTSDIKLLEFDSLSKEDQEKVLVYMKDIDIKNLNALLDYNQDITRDGTTYSSLLMQYLEELNEVIRKDDKNYNELMKIYIDVSIKNIKLFVIKDKIEKLLYDTNLRAIAVLKYLEEFESKEATLFEKLYLASKIKKERNINSLCEILNRCKITISSLSQQLKAINNAINSNNILITKMSIYDSIAEPYDVEFQRPFPPEYKTEIKKNVYIYKINRLNRINELFNINFSKLSELNELLNKEFNDDNENKINTLLAITEVELDKYLVDNKDKFITLFINKRRIIQYEGISHINIERLSRESEILYYIFNFYKDSLKEYEDELYKLLFDIATYDIDDKKSILFNTDTELYNHFVKILDNKIEDFISGKSEFALYLNGLGIYKKMKKMLHYYSIFNSSFIIYSFKNEKLSLLLACDNITSFRNFFENKKVISREKINLVNSDDLVWDDYIPRSTLYYLYELDGKKYPDFYDIYKLFNDARNKLGDDKDYYHLIINETINDDSFFKRYHEDRSKSNINDYYLPEGLIKINFDSKNNKYFQDKIQRETEYRMGLEDGWMEYRKEEPTSFDYDKEGYTNADLLLYRITEDMKKDITWNSIILPHSLRSISGNVFDDVKVNNLVIQSELESLDCLSLFEQNRGIGKFYLTFKDFRKSKVLYQLLNGDDKKTKKLLDYLIIRSYPNLFNRVADTNDSIALDAIVFYDETDKDDAIVITFFRGYEEDVRYKKNYKKKQKAIADKIYSLTGFNIGLNETVGGNQLTKVRTRSKD